LKWWNELLTRYLYDHSMPGEWYEEVRRRLANKFFKEEKDIVLKRHFDSIVRYDNNPGKDALSSLERIKATLGFPSDKKLHGYEKDDFEINS